MKLLQNAPTYTDSIHFHDFSVDVYLATPPAFYEIPTFDAILSYSVVMEATEGKGLINSVTPYYIPLPLEKLWICPETLLPLWNTTQFLPMTSNTQETVYWHKRGYTPYLLKKGKGDKPHNAKFGQGPYKEYRIPLPIHSCLHWRAFGVGDTTAIEKLLKNVQAVGKKRTQGHGVVKKWEITEINSFSYFHESRYIKAFPVDFPDYPKPPAGVVWNRYETGWTPPYWLASIFKECIV